MWNKPLTLVDRVQRGANLLDKRVPGWADRIDLTTLDLGDCDECVLGQLFGSYFYGKHALFAYWSAKRVRSHGFQAVSEQDENGDTPEFERLRAEWVKQIESRQRRARAGVKRAVDRVVADALVEVE